MNGKSMQKLHEDKNVYIDFMAWIFSVIFAILLALQTYTWVYTPQMQPLIFKEKYIH